MTRSFIIMGIFTTILNLCGCSVQINKNDSGLFTEMEEQIANSVVVFKNRPIYKKLNE